MLAALVLLLADAPAPGIVDPAAVVVPAAEAPARDGTPGEALDAFLEAHALHRRGEARAALARYLAFRAIAGAKALPERYRAVVDARVAKLLEEEAKAYAAACDLYRTDRGKGLQALRVIAGDQPTLPHARAARVLVATDGLRGAIDAARSRKDPKALEEAIRALPEGLFQYEAKSLLVELGGPDLRTPEEKGETKPDDPPDAKKAEGESTFKLGEDG